ncbi:MAG: DUF6264 family protein [Rhodoglobus sp.]
MARGRSIRRSAAVPSTVRVYVGPLPFSYAGSMTTTAPARGPLRIPDLIAGVLLVIIAALIGTIMLGYMTQLGLLSGVCEGIEPDGTRCSPAFLSTMTIVGVGIVVFAWFLSLGFFVVRVLRRRLAFWVPLVGIVAMIAGFYVTSAVLGASYLPAAG